MNNIFPRLQGKKGEIEMARKKAVIVGIGEVVGESKERSLDEIIAENKNLRETIERLGSTEQVQDTTLMRYMDEINKITKKARVESDKIKVIEITDHKNISLWTKDGKRIGPLHRDNAIATLKRFFELGIMLSSEQPTSEEIEAYMQTDEYKIVYAKFMESRRIKDKSRKAGQMQKLAEEIAKITGSTVDAINHVLKFHEVKQLSAGR